MLLKGILFRLPGFGSYRGRYAYFALMSMIGLITVAYIGWEYVNRTSRIQVANIEQRAMTAGAVADTQELLNHIDNRISRIITEPRESEIEDINREFSRLNIALLHLEKSLPHTTNGSTAVSVQELHLDARRLLAATIELVEVRTDMERWFPAMRLMREQMLPHNQAVLSELDTILTEVREALELEDQLEAINAISSLRHAWNSMVSELRLLVANRFGVFSSEASVGMRSRMVNIGYYAEEIPGYLQILRTMVDSDRLGFIGPEALDVLDRHHRDWVNASNQLIVLLDNPGWRVDLVILSESIDPMLEQMRQRLSALDLELDKQSAQDITQLTKTARTLSSSILGIAFFGILLITFAYIFLNRTLLRPIAETAMALKQEAQGVLDITPPPASLQETANLVEAFNEMRKQVHMRQQHLDHMAHHDALTRLPNRVLFRDRLEHALKIAAREGRLIGLMFLDLDRFKQVNDSLGHLVGDELLKIVAERLRALTRESDTVARLSGDEFAVLVEGINERDDMVPLAEKVLDALEQPIEIAEHELRITVSVGIAMAPLDDVVADNLIRDADTAMYSAKQQGRAAYRFFTDEMTHVVAESLQLENEIRSAVENGEFLFHFQPVVSLRNGELYCCEALMRWQHPEKGLMAPEVFLDVLDDTGLITSIIDRLLDQASNHREELSKKLGREVAVSVNLSARLMNDPGFCRGLLKRLVARDFPLGSLVLEITEDTLTRELAEANEFLQQVKNLGAKIALDDFGVGQASLSHLRQFPFDLVKIDRDFISNVHSDSNDANLVRAIIQLAHAFGMQVVAEGVETEQQLAFVRAQGCDYIQGYLVGVPADSEQVVACLSAGRHGSLLAN